MSKISDLIVPHSKESSRYRSGLQVIFFSESNSLSEELFKSLKSQKYFRLIKFGDFSLQVSDNIHNSIRIHHSLASKATDYVKKQHVFRLQTADQSEYLFQTSDSKELQSWIDTINFVAASFSAPPLEGHF